MIPRIAPIGVGRVRNERCATTPAALGHRGSNRQGRAHSHGSDTCMGEAGAGRVDDGCQNHRWQNLFRRVSRTGKVWGRGVSQNVVWYVVKTCCEKAGLERIAPHDLRRTCAKLCHSSGGELEQIQFLLGHASVQTTERYLGCKQNLGHPVNDRFSLVSVTEALAGQTRPDHGQITPAGDTIQRRRVRRWPAYSR